MILLFQFNPSSNNCTLAYQEFLIRYRKIETYEGHRNFCQNYEKLLSIDCEDCIVTHIYDRQLSSLTQKTSLKFKSDSTINTCQQVYCYANNPLKDLQEIPKTIDLRELGLISHSRDQESCGSCWAFGISGALENAMLQDQNSLDFTLFGGQTSQKLFTSTQFLISNIRGMSSYCQGGDSVAGFSYIMKTPDQIPTVESEVNYPYDFHAHYQNFTNNIDTPPKLSRENYLLPFQTFKLDEIFKNFDINETPVIQLFVNDKFSAPLVKQYLARGIAVITTMNTQETPNSQLTLSSYDGKSLIKNFGCKSGHSDHQVIFIGYGKYKGENAWLVRNSWGSQWGNQGSFYIREGSNDLCIENYAYAILSKNYDLESGIFEGKFDNDFKIVRGKNGFDADDGSFVPVNQLDLGSIIGSVVFIVLVVAVVGFLVFKYCKEKRSRYQRIPVQ